MFEIANLNFPTSYLIQHQHVQEKSFKSDNWFRRYGHITYPPPLDKKRDLISEWQLFIKFYYFTGQGFEPESPCLVKGLSHLNKTEDQCMGTKVEIH